MHRLDAIESKERRNEYYIAVRELLTDDVVAATLLALRVARFFLRHPGAVTRGCNAGDGGVDGRYHEGQDSARRPSTATDDAGIRR